MWVARRRGCGPRVITGGSGDRAVVWRYLALAAAPLLLFGLLRHAVLGAEQRVEFVTLAQGSTPEPVAERPGLFLAHDRDALLALADLLGMADDFRFVLRLQGVDPSAYLVVGVFAGPVPPGGPGLAVKGIRSARAWVRIEAAPEGSAVLPGEEAERLYPYHVVAVPRAGMPLRPGIRWCLYLGGRLQAEVVFPLPPQGTASRGGCPGA